MSIPNIITLGRILLVPFIVWAIASSQMEIAFAIFVVAGVSDAVDGFLAKRFNMASELGALLDPLADKALLVSIYVALGIWGAVPRWIVILVVSRDIMIVSAVIVSWLCGKHQCRECHLRHRIELRYHQWLHWNRFAEQP